jgi:heme-degrading monooxygenase HmoA
MSPTLRATRTTAAAALAALLPLSCAISPPFRGPGFDAEDGITHERAGETVWVAVTHGVLERRTRGPFDDHTQKVYRSMDQHPGYIGGSIRKEILGDQVWTMTVWATEADLDRFVFSKIHQDAVDAGEDALRSARFARGQVDRARIPLSWEEAEALLDDPRFSGSTYGAARH